MNDDTGIREALERAVKTVTLRPERGQRIYRNTATSEADTCCMVEEADRSLIVDVGKAVGGKDAGPNPSMLLRSALSSCVAIGIRQWASRKRIPIGPIRVVLETDVDARGQLGVGENIVSGFTAMRLEIRLDSPADSGAIEGLVRESLVRSPLMDVICKSQPVAVSVVQDRDGMYVTFGSEKGDL